MEMHCTLAHTRASSIGSPAFLSFPCRTRCLASSSRTFLFSFLFFLLSVFLFLSFPCVFRCHLFLLFILFFSLFFVKNAPCSLFSCFSSPFSPLSYKNVCLIHTKISNTHNSLTSLTLVGNKYYNEQSVRCSVTCVC